MTHSFRVAPAFQAVWLLAGLAQALRAGEVTADVGNPLLSGKGPSEARGVSYEEYADAQARWWRKCNVEAYRSAGNHDPQWDSQVEFIVTNGFGGDRTWTGLSTEERRSATQLFSSVADRGCRDPLFLMLYGNFLHGAGILHAATTNLEQSIALFAKTGYAYSTRLIAPSRLYRASTVLGQKDRAARASATLCDWLVEASADGIVRNGGQGYLADAFDLHCGKGADRDIQLDDRQAQQILAHVLSVKNADPWVRAYFAGRCHIRLGWNARGGGYANTVSSGGWKGFGEHLDEARKYYLEAYPLHPQFPHIAREMIAVTMADCGSGDLRLWFDRAATAQFDCGSTYSSYLWALRPRWGGSHEAMLSFGLECLRTRRFDTGVPQFFLRTVSDVASEFPEPYALYRQPQMWPLFVECYEGVLGATTKKEELRHHFSRYIALAWITRRPRDAVAIHARSDGNLNSDDVEAYDLNTDMLRALLRVCAGEFGPELQEATIALVEKRPDSPLEPIAKALPTIADPDVVLALEGLAIEQPLLPLRPDTTVIIETLARGAQQEALFQAWNTICSAGGEIPPELRARVEQAIGTANASFGMEPVRRKITDQAEYEAYIAQVEQRLSAPANAPERTRRNLALLRAKMSWCCPGSDDENSRAAHALVDKTLMPLLNQTPDKDALFDFLLHTLEHPDTCHHIKGYVPQFCAIGQYRSVREPDKEAAIIDKIAKDSTSDAEAVQHCKAAMQDRGSISLALRCARLLASRGQRVEARRIERRVERWVALSIAGGKARWPFMHLYNAVPGYEEAVLRLAEQSTAREDTLDSTWYMQADALLRLGRIDEAEEALARGDNVTVDKDRFVSAGRVFASTRAYAEWLYEQLDRAKSSGGGQAVPADKPTGTEITSR